jgi:hypothetical protein
MIECSLFSEKVTLFRNILGAHTSKQHEDDRSSCYEAGDEGTNRGGRCCVISAIGAMRRCWSGLVVLLWLKDWLSSRARRRNKGWERGLGS